VTVENPVPPQWRRRVTAQGEAGAVESDKWAAGRGERHDEQRGRD
jgi:hypothetical protein